MRAVETGLNGKHLVQMNMLKNKNCFLCKPDSDLIYLQESSFFCMLGLGPLAEGYSLIATSQHVPSMLDLDTRLAQKLEEFTQQLRQFLSPIYGEVLITEHGRVAPCVPLLKYGCQSQCVMQHEPHCFHAHRLVFPISLDLSTLLLQHGLHIESYACSTECHERFTYKGEYLYWERPDGTCVIASAPSQLVRQFFRKNIAALIGSPNYADWKEYPRLELIDAAKFRLGLKV